MNISSWHGALLFDMYNITLQRSTLVKHHLYNVYKMHSVNKYVTCTHSAQIRQVSI